MTIEIGDEVIAMYEKEKTYRGTVTHIPQDTGDMWYIKTPHGEMAINPQCGELIGLYKPETDLELAITTGFQMDPKIADEPFSIVEYCNSTGAFTVWRSWKDKMVRQGRPIGNDKMDWENLSLQDKELDGEIARYVITEFLKRGKAGGNQTS